MLTRFSVTMDRDVHDLALVLAQEQKIPFQHVALNALEKYYGMQLSIYEGNRGGPGPNPRVNGPETPGGTESRITHRRKPHRITPKLLRNKREKLRRKYLAKNQGTIMALNTRIHGLENELETERQNVGKVMQINNSLRADIANLQSTVMSQSNDIERYSNQPKTWQAEINNLRCQKFHLQGSIEALTMVINKLLDHRGAEFE
jgi:hypothetical protein